MKKSTLEAIITYIEAKQDNDELLAEVQAEYNRLTEKSRANAELYAIAVPIVEKVLSDTPMTARQIHDACCKELPDGFTANKVSYIMRNQLADKVEKHENGKNPLTYTRKM